MKKLLLACMGGLLLLAACTEKTKSSSNGMSDAASKNLASFRAVAHAFQTGDPSAIDSVVASDFVDHSEKGETGRDSLKAMVVMGHKMDSTMKMEAVRELADDEYVMGWMKYTGMGDGVMMPAGPYTMNAIEVGRFKDGKLVEHWNFMESSEMAKMMANMPHGDNSKIPPPPPNDGKRPANGDKMASDTAK